MHDLRNGLWFSMMDVLVNWYSHYAPFHSLRSPYYLCIVLCVCHGFWTSLVLEKHVLIYLPQMSEDLCHLPVYQFNNILIMMQQLGIHGLCKLGIHSCFWHTC